ncbi:MAG TPA: alpha/beta fold hydrolase [Candidatus Hydrogenedens sp.]|nr:alpha/beta fold hydrolase [Candidatus Hydrogenedens sp.]
MLYEVLTLLLVFFVNQQNIISDPPFYKDKFNLLYYIENGGESHEITRLKEWDIRKKHIFQNMLLVMGPLPDRSHLPPLEMYVETTEDMGSYWRKKITFNAEKNDRLPAYLLVPKNINGKRPAIVCLHQTIDIGKASPVGIGDAKNRHIAKELAERGYIVIVPDYPGFGDYKIDVYAMGYASATAKGIGNHRRCIDFLQTMEEVDKNKIGAIGHSLGGHNTLFLGAFDKRIKAMVTSCGFTSMKKYYNGDLTGWSHKGYMPRIKEQYQCNPDLLPFDFTEILGTLAPRPVFINAPIHDNNFEVSGVDDCVNSAKKIYALYKAEDNLKVVHPDCGHDFPPEIREEAYQFLDKHLDFSQK